MLPYSPLHHLLLEDFGAALVATSANLSGEPVLIEPEQVEACLRSFADRSELAGAAKFDALLGCVYGPVLSKDHPALFPVLSALLEQVAVFDLRRPNARWSVGEVADCIVGAAPPLLKSSVQSLTPLAKVTLSSPKN